MHALITGGSGYFGSLLAARLHAAGHDCRVLDITDHPGRAADIEFCAGDIRDERAVEQALRQVDTVFHCVAMVPLSRDRAQFDAVNNQATRALLDACLRNGVGKVVHLSSSAVYGVPESLPVTEQSAAAPREPYGVSKLAAEHHCHQYAARGLDVTILRPRTILGHGRLGIFQILFEWIRLGRRIPVLAGPEAPYQFIHADDLADACLLAAGRAGCADYNLGARDFRSIMASLQALCREADTGAEVIRLPRAPLAAGMHVMHALNLAPLAPYHALMYGRAMYFDCSKAHAELAWQPHWSADAMFLDSYRHYLAHRRDAPGGSRHQQPVRSSLLELFSRAISL